MTEGISEEFVKSMKHRGSSISAIIQQSHLPLRVPARVHVIELHPVERKRVAGYFLAAQCPRLFHRSRTTSKHTRASRASRTSRAFTGARLANGTRLTRVRCPRPAVFPLISTTANASLAHGQTAVETYAAISGI